MNLGTENLASLPLATRLLRCHELSEEALERATLAKTDAERAELVALANDWKSLAAEIERSVRMLWKR